jgi:hypothetical protein
MMDLELSQGAKNEHSHSYVSVFCNAGAAQETHWITRRFRLD